MHTSSLLRMKWFEESFAAKVKAEKQKILDVGSYDVNGTYRPLFAASRYQYVGLDVCPGPNVDLVPSSPYVWREIPNDEFDIVISGQAFEHVEFFWVVMEEMVRVLKKDGLLCLIVPRGFGEHRYPVDCYRFLADGMVALARYTCLDLVHAHTNCGPGQDPAWYSRDCADSMLIASKPYSGPAHRPNLENYVCHPGDTTSLSRPLGGWGR